MEKKARRRPRLIFRISTERPDVVRRKTNEEFGFGDEPSMSNDEILGIIKSNKLIKPGLFQSLRNRLLG